MSAALIYLHRSIEKSDELKRQFGLTGARDAATLSSTDQAEFLMGSITIAASAAREVRVRLLALSVAIPGLVLAPQEIEMIKSGG